METAWLIEREDPDHPGCVTGAFLGECNGVLKFTTSHYAIRYARKEDAEAAVRTYGLKNVVATDHVWDAVEANAPDQARDSRARKGT